MGLKSKSKALFRCIHCGQDAGGSPYVRHNPDGSYDPTCLTCGRAFKAAVSRAARLEQSRWDNNACARCGATRAKVELGPGFVRTETTAGPVCVRGVDCRARVVRLAWRVIDGGAKR